MCYWPLIQSAFEANLEYFFSSEIEILFKNSIFLWIFQNETQYEHSWSLELRLRTYYWASDRFMFIKNFWRPLRNLVVKIRRNTLFRSSRMGTQKSKVDFIVFHRFQPFDLWNQKTRFIISTTLRTIKFKFSLIF